MSEHLEGLKRNVSALLVGQVSRLLVQAAYFVLLARMLEPSSFGIFAVLTAIGALAAPFTALGLNTLMVKNVSRNENVLSDEWGRSLIFTVVGGLAFTALLTLAIPVFVQDTPSALAIGLILIADLVGLRLVDLSAAVWHTIGKSAQLAILPTALNVLRLGAAASLWAVASDATLETWAIFYCIATVPLGVVMTTLTTRRFGIDWRAIRATPVEIREGLLFSVSFSSQSAFNDIDKTILANLQNAASAGLYAAAYRVIDMAYAPIRSVAAAVYPRLFRVGVGGIRPGLALVREIAPMVFGFGFIGAVLVFIMAPYAPVILGAEYEGAVDAIRLLAPLIILRGASFMAADLLSAVADHGFRTVVQLLLVGLNVCGNFFLIPHFGIAGAVISTLACELLLAVILWLRVVVRTRLTAQHNLQVLEKRLETIEGQHE